MPRTWTPEQRAIQAERGRIIFSRLWRGRPKTKIQKERMSEAKLGVPKSEEHKEAMRQAHLFRNRMIRGIQEEFDCCRSEALVIYKERKLNGDYIDKQ